MLPPPSQFSSRRVSVYCTPAGSASPSHAHTGFILTSSTPFLYATKCWSCLFKSLGHMKKTMPPHTWIWWTYPLFPSFQPPPPPVAPHIYQLMSRHSSKASMWQPLPICPTEHSVEFNSVSFSRITWRCSTQLIPRIHSFRRFFCLSVSPQLTLPIHLCSQCADY